MSRAIGSSTATLSKADKDWDRQTGETITRTWQGTALQIRALEGDFKKFADKYTTDQNGAKWSATAQYTTQIPQIDVRVKLTRFIKAFSIQRSSVEFQMPTWRRFTRRFKTPRRRLLFRL
jgi:hypothetical protein